MGKPPTVKLWAKELSSLDLPHWLPAPPAGSKLISKTGAACVVSNRWAIKTTTDVTTTKHKMTARILNCREKVFLNFVSLFLSLPPDQVNR